MYGQAISGTSTLPRPPIHACSRPSTSTAFAVSAMAQYQQRFGDRDIRIDLQAEHGSHTARVFLVTPQGLLPCSRAIRPRAIWASEIVASATAFFLTPHLLAAFPVAKTVRVDGERPPVGHARHRRGPARTPPENKGRPSSSRLKEHADFVVRLYETELLRPEIARRASVRQPRLRLVLVSASFASSLISKRLQSFSSALSSPQLLSSYFLEMALPVSDLNSSLTNCSTNIRRFNVAVCQYSSFVPSLCVLTISSSRPMPGPFHSMAGPEREYWLIL